MPHNEEQEQGHQESSMNPVQVQEYLSGLQYPADKQTIVDTAQQQGADETVMDTLNRLPDREYEGPTQVSEEISNFT